MSGLVLSRELLLAYYKVGRDLQEFDTYGRVLTEGERREASRLQALSANIRQVGWDHAMSGGKLKANPHPGDSLEWWCWHDGYRSAEKQRAAERRSGAAPTPPPKFPTRRGE